MLLLGAIISVGGGLGYALPAIIGLESRGIPSPGETALILAAVLASQGKLQIWLVIVIASASAIAGDNLGYLLGRKLGGRGLTAPVPGSSPRLGPRRYSSGAGSRSCGSRSHGWRGSTACTFPRSSSTTRSA